MEVLLEGKKQDCWNHLITAANLFNSAFVLLLKHISNGSLKKKKSLENNVIHEFSRNLPSLNVTNVLVKAKHFQSVISSSEYSLSREG